VIDSVYMCLVSYFMHIFIRIGGWINSHSCLYPMIIHVRLKPTVKYEYKYDIGYIRKKKNLVHTWCGWIPRIPTSRSNSMRQSVLTASICT